ncbi:relaxase/mobilization nuclease domain-containing protein [Arachidicoccus sp.]|uniref:relaxase/mobilization nuclease domain-containing protein n=1 Tax=Arachidicoccus sp. TaxID=1872624 RepID=UPI003D21FCE1
MVTVINSSKNLNHIFYYNENKVKEDIARSILAVNYPMEIENLSTDQRLKFLRKFTSLNENVKWNSVHISINFHEKDRLNESLFKMISQEYMQQIGFGQQPYLVYQHFDAAHPHLHIVTTCIQANGKCIRMFNLGKIQSENARKNIEIIYHLMKASDAAKARPNTLKTADVLRAQYGDQSTKVAIQNVLDKVLFSFKYSNLIELNAILNQYNILATRGRENSWIYRNNGLMYCILNEKGSRVSMPIKSSVFFNKPTLKFLSERFAINEKEK